jgi:predicted esterase
MDRDDLPEAKGNKFRLTMPLVKTIAVVVIVLLFVLLNIFVLINASSLVPSERTQRLLWFSLNPEFWPTWIAQALWMFAIGAVLATSLRLKIFQTWIGNLAKIPFPFPIVYPAFRMEWRRKLAEYPLDRRSVAAVSSLVEKAKRGFHPRHLPLVVVISTLLGTGYFILSRFVDTTQLFSLYNLTVVILRLPFLFVEWFFVSPLYDLVQTGTLSWRLPGAIIIPFLLVMMGYLYGRKIKKFVLHDDVRPHLIRYSVIVAVVYALFLPALSPFLQVQYHNINESVFRLYHIFIWEPFYLYLNEGILSWRSVVFVLFFIALVGIPYYGFRRIFYAPNRGEALRKAVYPFAITAFLLVYFFHKILWFVFIPLWEGMNQIYQYILDLPTQVWYSIYFVPCCFLYFSEVSWKLVVAPVLLFVMVFSYVFNPFRRWAKHIGFSEAIFYALFWTLLLVSCFFVIVWKILLLAGVILLADYVIRSVGMPKIRIAPTPEGKKIAYAVLVGLLVVFDLFIVVVDIYVIHYYCSTQLYTFFWVPFADFANTRQLSWSLLGPTFVMLLVLFFVFLFIQAHYGMKSLTSLHTRTQKTFLYGSLAVALVFLNILCFVALFTAGANIPWSNVRLWPWWAMILPVSLIVFSVSGLLLTRKMKPAALLFLCFLALPHSLQAAESPFVLLEPAKFVSAREAREAAKSESQAGQGGFLADPKIVDCFAAMEYRYTGGRYEDEPIKFRLRSPLTMEPGKKYPLVVWFHGRGESGDDNARQLAHLQLSMEFFAGPNQQDFFMLATQCPGDNRQWTRSMSPAGKGDAPMTIAGEIMEALLREYPIDENRISACGFSSGGTGSWEFGRKSPRKLAALGSCSGNPVREAKPEEYLGPAIWAFVNTGDRGVPSEDAIVFVDAINTGGGNAFLTLYDAEGHNSWTRAMRDEKLIGWLILQSLVQPGPPQGIICRPLTTTQQFTWFWLPLLIIVACIVPLFFGRRKEKKL